MIVEGNRIKAVDAARNPPGEGMRVIDGGGRTLMPGLIDAHWHAMMAALDIRTLMTADIGYITLAAADQAEKTLMRGFTSVRDMAGPSFGLKRAIDAGLVAGPRIWPSGAMISQTSGHGDFRPRSDRLLPIGCGCLRLASTRVVDDFELYPTNTSSSRSQRSHNTAVLDTWTGPQVRPSRPFPLPLPLPFSPMSLAVGGPACLPLHSAGGVLPASMSSASGPWMASRTPGAEC